MKIISNKRNKSEIKEARSKLRRSDCPRRYCWYWHSSSYDFDMDIYDGCEVSERFGSDYPNKRDLDLDPPKTRECCRASGNNQHPDYYDPREPHLMEDGFPTDYFSVVGKKYRTRKYNRRKKQK